MKREKIVEISTICIYNTLLILSQQQATGASKTLLTGNNTEKIWVHRFLAKQKMIETEGLGGSCMGSRVMSWLQWGIYCLEAPHRVQGDALVNAWVQIPWTIFFLVQHAKMVTIYGEYSVELSFCCNPNVILTFSTIISLMK